MAKSHSFWVIIDGAVPTAFRAKNREDLLPTLTQLKRTQPNVVLMWFERGRVWESPIAARAALEARRSQPRPRDRKPEWRPGGDHRDPRAKYQISRDEKRARFKKRRDFERRSEGDEGKPFGGGRPSGSGRPSGGGRPPGGSRPAWSNRPAGGDRPPRRDGAAGFERPSSRPRQYSDTSDRRPRGPGIGRPPGGNRPPGGGRPPGSGRAPGGGRPAGSGGGDWRSKPRRPDSSRAPNSRPKGPWKPGPDRGGSKPPRRRRDDDE